MLGKEIEEEDTAVDHQLVFDTIRICYRKHCH